MVLLPLLQVCFAAEAEEPTVPFADILAESVTTLQQEQQKFLADKGAAFAELLRLQLEGQEKLAGPSKPATQAPEVAGPADDATQPLSTSEPETARPHLGDADGAAGEAIEQRISRGTRAEKPPPDVLAWPWAPGRVDHLPEVVVVGTEHGWTCSGVVVATGVVLTASHCGSPARVGFGLDIDQLVVLPVLASARPEDGRLDAQLLHIGEHPAVRSRIWRTATDPSPPLGEVLLAGYGATDPRGTDGGAGIKRWTTLSTVGWGCEGPDARRYGCRPGVEMTLPAPGGRDTCGGDSGGPVYERVGDGWRLLAVTSRSLVGDGQSCGRGGIYVRLDRLDPWMTNTIRAWNGAREEEG